MKALLALCLVTSRGLQQKATSASMESEGDSENDIDDLEMLDWMSPESLAIVEKQTSDEQVAFAENYLTMGQLLSHETNRRTIYADMMPIWSICASFGLSGRSCERVGTYLGDLGSQSRPGKVTVRVRRFSSRQIECDRLYEMRVREFCKVPAARLPDLYRQDFCKVLNASSNNRLAFMDNRHFFFKFGDRIYGKACYPTIYKTRPMSNHKDFKDSNHVLLDLNHKRHWGALDELSRADLPWSLKSKTLVWRGISTGICDATALNTRLMLCKKWFASSDARIDVGFTEVVQNCTDAGEYVKEKKTMESQLRSKYIMVVNGNDKASSLSWALASNSVPFMVEPDVESWLLESSLKAWEHYVPVKPDFSDLSSQLDWASDNDVAAERIAQAGKEYIEQFRSPRTEMNISAAVLTAYFDRVEITGGGSISYPNLEDECLESS